MSRVGKYPVEIPSGAEVSIAEGMLKAKGKNGELEMPIMEYVDVTMAENLVTVTPNGKSKRHRQAWGTTRSLINNIVIGVTDGFTRRLEVKGVGYRAQVQGNNLKLALGFSHDIDYPIPSDLKVEIEGDRNATVIAISGSSKQRVGQMASEIRAFRPPEPYKGKGVKYAEETILRKEGKKK